MTDLGYICWSEGCIKLVDVICNNCDQYPICYNHSYNLEGKSVCKKCYDKERTK